MTQGMKIQYNLHVCINLLYEIGWVIELGHNSRNEDPIQSAYVYKLDVHTFDFLYSKMLDIFRNTHTSRCSDPSLTHLVSTIPPSYTARSRTATMGVFDMGQKGEAEPVACRAGV